MYCPYINREIFVVLETHPGPAPRIPRARAPRINGRPGMNEWVYVLTVEALVFGLLATLVTAQRLDVFAWPDGQTWPVLGTSVLVLLAYALGLLVVCSVVTASRLGALAADVCHAFARSIGRLVAAAGLWVALQSAAVLTHARPEWPLLLCQLWGTSCRDPGTVLWEYSYSMYLAVLLPLLLWCGGFQLVAAGQVASDSLTQSTSARRIMLMNVVSVLLLLSTSTLDENTALGCELECAEVDGVTAFDQKPGAVRVMSMRVLLVAFAAMCADVVTGILASFVFADASIPALLLFVAIHVAQMATVPGAVLLLDLALPAGIMWTCCGLACALGLMDIGEATARALTHARSRRGARHAPQLQAAPQAQLGVELASTSFFAPLADASFFAPLADARTPGRITPFAFQQNRRKRFMFGNSNAWPYTTGQAPAAAPAAAASKKTK